MFNPFAKIWGGITFVAVHVAAGFKALFGAEVAADFAKASLAMLKSASGQIVLGIVHTLMVIEMPGDQKRLTAFEQAVKELAAKGLVLGKDIFASEINLLIEIAVTALKGKFAPVDPQ